MGLREDILGANDRPTETIDVPEWGRKVTIRAMSGAERDHWEQNLMESRKAGKPVPNFRAKLATLILIDDQGKRVFSDADADALGEKSGAALDRIFDAHVKLNKLSDADVKGMEKNS